MGPRRGRLFLAHCQASRAPGPEQEREERWAQLFEQLDLNKDGRVDILELQAGLSGQGLSKGSAEKVRPRLYSGVCVCERRPAHFLFLYK